MKENKFMVGEEEEQKTLVNSNHTKKRHHVKRKSSGRVHVAKLAPLSRANATDTELDGGENERPVMRRSQSQRSLHRISSDRKGFTSMTRRKSTASENKPVVQETKDSTSSSTHSTNNPASISSRAIAEPVEQTLNAVATALIVPKSTDNKLYSIAPPPTTTTTTTSTKSPAVKKQPLRSQFINTNTMDAARPVSRNMSRTQQKLLLQKQQCQVDDETSPMHPRNMLRINRELETLNREYRCIKRYEDPMRASLLRCLEKKPPKVTRMQLGAQHQSMSMSILPTASDAKKHVLPHQEQRQIAHRHHHLKAIASARSNDSSTMVENTPVQDATFWNGAAALIDKVLFNNY